MGKEEGKDGEELQPPLDDFLDTNPNTVIPKEQKKKTKRLLIAEAKRHLKMFFKILLKSADKNSIRWQPVSVLTTRVLSELEQEGVCFRKIVNGKRRLFKKFYCRKTLDDWKECPDYFCPIWSDKDDPECPYDQE